MDKIAEAFELLSRAKLGQEKHSVLYEVMKDPGIREAIRREVDPNLQAGPKHPHLKGVGVVTLNKAHAGLAKQLHMAMPVAVVNEIEPAIWELVAPDEAWSMMPTPNGMRCLLGKDGIVRNGTGFLAKLGTGYDSILEGVMTLPSTKNAVDYYERVRAGKVEGAKFMAADIVDPKSSFTDRRKRLETLGVECLPVHPVTGAARLFSKWKKDGCIGATFRKNDAPYFIGIDAALVVCHFVQVIQDNVEYMRRRRNRLAKAEGKQDKG